MNQKRHLLAFTIVELLVVIVIIGILATITFVSYSNISRNAKITSLQSDLRNASRILELDKVLNENYPVSKESANSGNGLKSSPDTAFVYIKFTNGYCLSAKSSSDSTLSYHMIEDGQILDGPCPNMWSSVVAGGHQTCGIDMDNKAYCWGYNTNGELGDNTNTNNLYPSAIYTAGLLNGKTIKTLSSSINTGTTDFTCSIASDDNAYCWGSGTNWRLGDLAHVVASNTPVAVHSGGTLVGKTIKKITTGLSFACAIASDDNAYCWGYNNTGELGVGSNTSNELPTAVSKSGVLSGKTIKAISAGMNHACVIASNDLAYCWGSSGTGSYGKLGDNTTNGSPSAVAVYMSGAFSGKTVKSISVGYEHTCAIASDNLAYCWGRNNYRQLGDNTTVDKSAPTLVYNTAGPLNGKTIKSIAAGYDHTCVIASDDLVYCWGENGYGAVGDGTTTDRITPVSVDTSGVLGGKTIRSISAGYRYTCVVASDYQSYCWGDGVYGKLGQGLTTRSLVPVAMYVP